MDAAWNGEAWSACQRYCERLGAAEYKAFVKKRKRKSERYNPSQYLRDLCHLLGYGAEEEFKARKMLEGYSSELAL